MNGVCRNEYKCWRAHSAQFAKGVTPPQTIESLQAAWERDQELIDDQRREISRLKETVNQLRQKLDSMKGNKP